jgi:hypothetical protein
MQNGCGVLPASNLKDMEEQRTGSEGYYSRVPSVKVKNEGSYTSIAPYVFMARFSTSIKYNFTFTLIAPVF